jgi:hypothetical protein
MNKALKGFMIGAAAFVAYRLYSLWSMVNSLNWSFQNVRFTRPKFNTILDSYIMSVAFKVHNPSSTTLWINGLNGFIEYDGYILGRYSMPKVRINAGETKLNIDIDLDPKYVASVLIPDLVSRKAPVMTLVTNANFFLGLEITNRFKFNVRDYLPEGVSQLFFK